METGTLPILPILLAMVAPISQDTTYAVYEYTQQSAKRGDGMKNGHSPVHIRPPPV
jgi:hypothetical protein